MLRIEILKYGRRRSCRPPLDVMLNDIYNVVMILRFEWDARKEYANRRKHGISFDEAQSVFFDENAVQFFDEPHSGAEDRFLLLGLSVKLRTLVVCHCERAGGDVIRIISARKATPVERKYYPGGGA